MVGSLGMALGKQRDGTFGCGFQAFVTNANYLSAILWTTVIAYQVYLAVVCKTLIMNMTRIHLVCWLLPIVVSLLPLVNARYANTGSETAAWCFFQSSDPEMLMFWQVSCFYFWVVASQLLNLSLIIRCEYEISRKVAVGSYILNATRRLNIYPLVITLCWMPISAYDLGVNKFRSYETATVLAILPGFILSFFFFAFNPFVTKRWRKLIMDNCCCGGDRSDRDHLITADLFCDEGDIEEQPDYVPRATEHNGTMCDNSAVKDDLPIVVAPPIPPLAQNQCVEMNTNCNNNSHEI